MLAAYRLIGDKCLAFYVAELRDSEVDLILFNYHTLICGPSCGSARLEVEAVVRRRSVAELLFVYQYKLLSLQSILLNAALATRHMLYKDIY